MDIPKIFLILPKLSPMNECQILTNRLERVKLIQKRYIDLLHFTHSKEKNNFYYGRFARACEIANRILERMVNLIMDKENIGVK